MLILIVPKRFVAPLLILPLLFPDKFSGGELEVGASVVVVGVVVEVTAIVGAGVEGTLVVVVGASVVVVVGTPVVVVVGA
jgi:hypothetical protein